ncbi:MAG: precorrin-3B C(17)-methyltransferase [Alphaproteobacteria bacterium]|nr:precorrin-3B C(17)-methyltransferase [Alphaproteobacteria bacterium]
MGVNPAIALVALTADGGTLARRLQESLPGAQVHGLSGRVEDCDIAFTKTGDALTSLFRAGHPIIGICASGILIRTLSASLSDKHTEPPVIAISPDGASIVPLLGGHHGANRLATEIAHLTGGTAAITTAGETIHGIALDDPPLGWTVANPERAKDVMADILAGGKPCLVIEAGDPGWLESLPLDHSGDWMIRISDRNITPNPNELLIYPPTLVVGVGCERDCDPNELRDLVYQTLSDAGLAPQSVTAIVSIDVKADEPALHVTADSFGVPARFFSAVQLEAETPRTENPSDIVFREVGTHGVSESAALAAVGPKGSLIVAKHKSRRATCAIARGQHVESSTIGRARGHLSIVGTGPGNHEYRIPATDIAVAKAQDVVGYGPYLDLLGPLVAGKTRHDFNLGAEIDRCSHALELAGQGRNVALVSSGDPGIFAMATLVFELLDQEANPNWQRISIDVHPGVSAMQLAAARAGAPLGHDFCAISLSDLLTPWPAILGRLEAAAEVDFVVALYNPRSRKRHHQIETARDILLAHRPADTPVIVARNLARDGETLEIVRLSDLQVESIDMLTVVIIGNSQSRLMASSGRAWAYTPRGYAKKRTTQTGT